LGVPVPDEKWAGARLLRVVSIVLLVQGCAISQDPPRKTDAVVEHIVGAAMTRGGAIAFLETLTDTIGGRVTGSPQSQAASELILQTLKDAGFDDAHIEDYPLTSRWRRGSASGEVLSPVKQPILIGSYGWSPGSNGRVEAPLVATAVAADGKLSGDLGKLRGAAVLVDLTSGTDLSFAPNYVVRRSAVARQLAAAGAAAMLIQSEKPDRMLYTSAAGIYPRAPLPLLSIAKEDALFVRRLLKKGAVKVGLDVQNFFDLPPVKERNVIADLPGTSPDQVVLLGAHFDSWDPAQGAKDNGAGVAEVLEIARILKSLGVKPKVTIRFAFFSGEEQACLGSRAYVELHKDQLDHHRAVLITDDGAQRPLGFLLHGRTDLEMPAKRVLSDLAALGADAISSSGDLSSDDQSFVVVGVPTLSLSVEPGDYDNQHHTITDTLDKVDPQMLAMDTAVLAVAAYAIADADQGMGRRLSSWEVDDLLKKTGQAEYVELDYGRREK
jgi:carboxypeptidase Q